MAGLLSDEKYWRSKPGVLAIHTAIFAKLFLNASNCLRGPLHPHHYTLDGDHAITPFVFNPCHPNLALLQYRRASTACCMLLASLLGMHPTSGVLTPRNAGLELHPKHLTLLRMTSPVSEPSLDGSAAATQKAPTQPPPPD